MLEYKDVLMRCAARWDSFYLYDERRIRESVGHLKANFPSLDFLYSIKCNANPYVLRAVFGQGFGADAASAGEVRLARETGLSADRVYYSAPGKSVNDIKRCVEQAHLIADSVDEIGRIQAAAEEIGIVADIGLRVNPAFSFEGEGARPSKFGIDEEQALRFVRANPYKNIRVTGIHVHLRSQVLNAGYLSAYYDRVFRLAGKFAQVCGPLAYVNMGSGMGVQYAPTDAPLNLSALGAAVEQSQRAFRAAYPDTRVIVEVGRYAVCKSGFYVTRVMDRKVSCGKTYLILKNTLNGFIRPSLARLVEHYAAEKSPAGAEPLFTSVDAFECLPLKEGPASEVVTLVGNLCTAADVVAENVLLPHLVCGDLVVLTNAGSYAAVLSPFQFSSQEKPAELFLTNDGEILEATADQRAASR